MAADIASIARRFLNDGGDIAVREIGDGNINSTWRVTCGGRDYILQRINTYVFTDPIGLMRNIRLVTEHIVRAYRAMGVDTADRVLAVIPTTKGELCWLDEDGGYYRMYNFISGAVAYNQVASPDLFREAARGFGEFARLLSDFPAESLTESIPFFHHTVRRFAAFKASVEKDAAGRVPYLKPEIDFLMEREGMMGSLVEALDSGELPLRVAHNDTKINNVMLDAVTHRAKCVIDLDTVMPGTYLFDFGDAIRSGAATLIEDSPEYDGVHVDMSLFEAFAQGYVGELKSALTEGEIRLMAKSALVITCEQAMRFLTDYIDGDKYYKIRTPDHNLVRARNQIALVRDMEKNYDRMDAVCRAAAR